MLAEHCRHARYVWNLAAEQQQHWQPGRRAPGYNEQCAQLTAARAEHDWLAAGSQTVQQQALRDFAQAMHNFFAGTPWPDLRRGQAVEGPAASARSRRTRLQPASSHEAGNREAEGA
jgi:hypothetical protein